MRRSRRNERRSPEFTPDPTPPISEESTPPESNEPTIYDIETEEEERIRLENEDRLNALKKAKQNRETRKDKNLSIEQEKSTEADERSEELDEDIVFNIQGASDSDSSSSSVEMRIPEKSQQRFSLDLVIYSEKFNPSSIIVYALSCRDLIRH